MSCYNEEAVLERSIDSLEKITYQNYRVILIDDKSSDNTLQIMHSLAKKYSNIEIKENCADYPYKRHDNWIIKLKSSNHKEKSPLFI